ncbi:hypothetical protein GPA22_16040 [Aromatoleum toluvorans]|uniref:Uncharacterized protein n=1 Tax=Aromatoleum toluvorans TaxID=92002 RepID=A0ABX1Q0L4_9RHOO|nr:hypothetical protein [Aromatoleum toluvorans]NMG45228.1 hypothetical protein [Aromatoleum toluvorans]
MIAEVLRLPKVKGAGRGGGAIHELSINLGLWQFAFSNTQHSAFSIILLTST